MRIQHNIMAMNAYRNYTGNSSALSKNLEKLSSGYKINRAGDDAAGLAISEKMRAQISGLQQASSNAKSGINMVQTAEGSLTEVHDMLNRMVTLSDQSANGTYDNETDRANLQKEVSQLKSEINRIADSSNFNGIKLLDGSMDSTGTIAKDLTPTVSVSTARDAGTAAVKPAFSVSLDGLSFSTDNTGTGNGTVGITVGGVAITSGNITLAADKTYDADAIGAAFNSQTATINGVSYTIAATDKNLTFTTTTDPTTATQAQADLAVTLGGVTGTGATVTAGSSINTATQVITPGAVAVPATQAAASFTLTDAMIADGNTISIGGTDYTLKVGDDSTVTGANLITISDAELASHASDLASYAGDKLTAAASGNTMFSVGNTGATMTLQSLSTDTTDLSTSALVEAQVSVSNKTAGTALTLQIGDTSDSFNQLNVNIQDMHADSLGIGDIDISTQAGAKAATDLIKAAINTVSSTRGNLGALQNRLDHTINNLGVMTENIQDAESTVRDTDVAEEMMAYTKNNILVQSAQAMLAQANQVPQGVLQLLQ